MDLSQKIEDDAQFVEPEPSPAEKYNIKLASTEVVEAITAADIEPVTVEDITPEFIDLTKRMLKFLVAIEGLGLAGPQLGMKKSFFVYWTDKDNPRVVYNPVYYPESNAKMRMIEKCLTYGKIGFHIVRYKRIRAVWYEYDDGGEDIPVEKMSKYSAPGRKLVKRTRALAGLDAEVFQHETDHCKGITIAQIGKVAF